MFPDPPAPTDDLLAQAAEMRAGGASWTSAAAELDTPPEELRRLAREYAKLRLRRYVDGRLGSGSINVVDLGRYAAGAGRDYDVIDAEDIPKRP